MGKEGCLSCFKCKETLRSGIHCVQCKNIFHRKCEKVPAGEGKSSYLCKLCSQKRSIFEEENHVLVESQAEDLSNEIANTSDSNLCFSKKSECMFLREENEKLKTEIESLKEMKRILEEERNKLESIKSNDQPSNPISR